MRETTLSRPVPHLPINRNQHPLGGLEERNFQRTFLVLDTDSTLWEQVGPPSVGCWERERTRIAQSVPDAVRSRPNWNCMLSMRLRPPCLSSRPTQLLPRENFNSPAVSPGWVGYFKAGERNRKPIWLWVLAISSGPSGPQRKLTFESLCVFCDYFSIGSNWRSGGEGCD